MGPDSSLGIDALDDTALNDNLPFADGIPETITVGETQLTLLQGLGVAAAVVGIAYAFGAIYRGITTGSASKSKSNASFAMAG